MSLGEFETELVNKLIENLHLEEISLDEITSESPLFSKEGGFEFDSIDAIEIELMISREFGIDIHPSERSESTFATLGVLAGFIQKNRGRDIRKTKSNEHASESKGGANDHQKERR